MGVFLMSVAKGGALAGAAVALGISFAGLPVIGIAAADSADTAASQGSEAGAATGATTGSTTSSKGQRQGGKARTGASARAASPTDTATSAQDTSDSAASAVGSSLRSAASDAAGSAPSASRGSISNPRSAHRSRPGPAAGQPHGDSPVIGPADVETPAGSPDEQQTAAVDTVADSNVGADVVSGAEATDSQARPVAAATSARLAAFHVASASAVTDIFSGILGSIQGFFEGALLLVRRAFFNQAPTVDPVQLTGQSEGLITGTIGAVDPEGEGISYSLVQAPLYGTVAIASDGTYTYTPGDGFDGVDAFTVAAADDGPFHFNLLNPFRGPSTQAVVSVTQGESGARVNFNFIYGTGSQYWSQSARSALQTTAILLSSYFVVDSPVTVTYDVTGEYSPLTSTLATAGSDLVSTDPGFYQTVVQNKILNGVDSNGAAADGVITWNFGNAWAFGNSVSNSQYDFQSTAMHELLHTLGFLSNVDSAGSNGGDNWTQFDSFVVTSNGTNAIGNDYKWKTAFNPNLTGSNGGLYFGGPNAVAAYGGPVPLYTPNPWQSGSSMSHLDDSTFTGNNEQLMNAVSDTGLGVRELSEVELGILQDLGYTIAPHSVSAFLFFGLLLIRRRRVSIAS